MFSPTTSFRRQSDPDILDPQQPSPRELDQRPTRPLTRKLSGLRLGGAAARRLRSRIALALRYRTRLLLRRTALLLLRMALALETEPLSSVPSRLRMAAA